FVAAGHSAVVEDVFFEGVDPVVDDFSEGAGRLGGGGEAFGEPPVDGFEPVQRGFGFGDLDFGDGEAGAFGAFGEPAGEEGFSGTVFAADGFEACAARAYGGEFLVEHGFVPVESDGEQVEAVLGHGSAAERVEDFAAAGGADGFHLGGTFRELFFKQRDVEFHGSVGVGEDEHREHFHVEDFGHHFQESCRAEGFFPSGFSDAFDGQAGPVASDFGECVDDGRDFFLGRTLGDLLVDVGEHGRVDDPLAEAAHDFGAADERVVVVDGGGACSPSRGGCGVVGKAGGDGLVPPGGFVLGGPHGF